MSWRPSSELVSVRTQALVERDGRQAVADFYGVSTRTVRRWEAGGNPQRASDAVSITRRGRDLTGAVVQDRSSGRFSTERTVYNPSITRAVRTIGQRRREQRATEISVARNQRQREMAESRATTVTYTEATDLDRNLDRLRRAEEARREGGWEYESAEWYDWWLDEYGYEYDWEDFRTLYEQMSG